MLGALLAALPLTNPDDPPNAATIEDEAEDSHWVSNKNRFEDWFLNGNNAGPALSDPEIYY